MRLAPGPSSESLQGRKPRWVKVWRCCARYGDLSETRRAEQRSIFRRSVMGCRRGAIRYAIAPSIRSCCGDARHGTAAERRQLRSRQDALGDRPAHRRQSGDALWRQPRHGHRHRQRLRPTLPALAATGDGFGHSRRGGRQGRRRRRRRRRDGGGGVDGGGVDLAFVNPSALLTQAYRGVGLFSAPLPVRIVAVYPSWDRFVFMVHPRTQIRSLADIKAKRYPLRVSVREDPTHSTLVLIDQAFALHGFALKDIESWGGRLVLCGGPSDVRRPRAAAARRDRRGLRRGHQGVARRGSSMRPGAD